MQADGDTGGSKDVLYEAAKYTGFRKRQQPGFDHSRISTSAGSKPVNQGFQETNGICFKSLCFHYKLSAGRLTHTGVMAYRSERNTANTQKSKPTIHYCVAVLYIVHSPSVAVSPKTHSGHKSLTTRLSNFPKQLGTIFSKQHC